MSVTLPQGFGELVARLTKKSLKGAWQCGINDSQKVLKTTGINETDWEESGKEENKEIDLELTQGISTFRGLIQYLLNIICAQILNVAILIIFITLISCILLFLKIQQFSCLQIFSNMFASISELIGPLLAHMTYPHLS